MSKLTSVKINSVQGIEREEKTKIEVEHFVYPQPWRCPYSHQGESYTTSCTHMRWENYPKEKVFGFQDNIMVNFMRLHNSSTALLCSVFNVTLSPFSILKILIIHFLCDMFNSDCSKSFFIRFRICHCFVCTICFFHFNQFSTFCTEPKGTGKLGRIMHK